MASWLLGVPWQVCLAAGALYGGVALPGLWRVAAALAGPGALGVGAAAGPVAVGAAAVWMPAAWLAVAVLAVAPLWRSLGGHAPWLWLAAAAGAGILVLAGAWLSPWRAFAFASDVAPRVQVAVLAIAAMAATAAARTSYERRNL